MKTTKTAPFCRMFIHSMSFFVCLHGAQLLYDTLEALTPGLVSMLLTNVWYVNKTPCSVGSATEIRVMLVGGTKLLCESPVQRNPEAWLRLLQSLLVLIQAKKDALLDLHLETLEEELGGHKEFDGVYSKLAYSSITVLDPCAEVASMPIYFATAVSNFIRGTPGPHVDSLRGLDEAELVAFRQTLSTVGVHWP